MPVRKVEDPFERVRSAVVSFVEKRSAKELSVASGVPENVISMFKKRKRVGMGLLYFKALCAVLKREPTTGKSIPVDGMREESAAIADHGKHSRIPIVGSVDCGTPEHPAEAVTVRYEGLDGEVWDVDHADIGRHMFASAMRGKNNRVLGCKVRGTSMQPLYYDLDLLLVEKTSDLGLLKDGDHVVVDLTGRGEFVMKEYYSDPPLLMSANRTARPISRPAEAVLWGFVVAMFRVGVPGGRG